MGNFWLIPMKFETCDFEQMQKEWNRNEKIMWEVKGAIDGKLATSLKKGDIVYFYVSELPSGSKKSLSRIMLRGIIEDEPHLTEKKKVYWKSEDDDLICGFSIGCISTLPKEKLEDDTFLSLEELRKNPDFKFINPQGKRIPNKSDKNLSEALINFLENIFKKNSYADDFPRLIEHFNQECFFCGKIGNKKDHETFLRRNGTKYYEIHHFIQQYKGKKLPELINIINAPENQICLCANCHRRIHLGREDDVNEMIDCLWNDEKIQQMLVRNDFSSIVANEKYGDNPLTWIKNTYTPT